jgi:hypothetical protein
MLMIYYDAFAVIKVQPSTRHVDGEVKEKHQPENYDDNCFGDQADERKN